MNERKSLKSHFKFHTSIAILPADKDRAAIIPNHEDYLEKCIDHIHNAPRHLFKKDTTTKMKVDCGKLLKMYVKSLKNS